MNLLSVSRALSQIKEQNGNQRKSGHKKGDDAENMSVFEWLRKRRDSRTWLLLIVFIAIFLDNMLLTTIVPIMPTLLFEMDHPDLAFNLTNKQLMESMENKLSVTTSNPPTSPKPYRRKLHHSWYALEPHCKYGYLPSTKKYKVDGRSSYYLLCSPSPELLNLWNRTNDKSNLRAAMYNSENVRNGVLFATKATIQLITNPFIGPITNKIGYTVPMFTGFLVMMTSTIIFAFAKTYWLLLFARAFQGIGSSCSSVAGMGMIADKYTEDSERGQAMGIALSGLALGVLVGPVFGGFMFEFVSKESPFLVLAALALFDGLLQLAVLRPKFQAETSDGAPIRKLIKDPYILIAAGSITLGNMGIAVLEPTLPLWMMRTMNAPNWEQGAAFLPASISYLIGTNIFGFMAHKLGRWLTAAIGLVTISVCLALIPLATNLVHLIPTNTGLGLAIGMVDSSMMPTMGALVDARHASVYGSVYAIADVAFCIAFAFGPLLGGVLVNGIGFSWTMLLLALLTIAYTPLTVALRKASKPCVTEKQGLLKTSGVTPDPKQITRRISYRRKLSESDEE